MATAVLLLAASVGACSAPGCTQRSLVLAADPGHFSGLPEVQFVLDHLQDVSNITSSLEHCATGYEGTLGGRNVALITTGIGLANAAACAVEVLYRYATQPGAVPVALWLGTSGWSAARGGVMDPAACDTPGKQVLSDPKRLHAVGDVCVGAIGVDWGCGFLRWPTNATTECMLPLRTGHDQTSVFGLCNYNSKTADAQSVYDAQSAMSLPAPPAKLLELQTRFWNATWGGFGIQNGPLPGATRLIPWSECAEIAGNTFWNGIPDESLCRRFAANEISRLSPQPVSYRDVSCVSAMEAAGWMPVFMKRHDIPFVNIRSASNYAVSPLRKEGANWIRDDSWLPEGEDEWHRLGYHYAIKTSSAVVLRYFGITPNF